MRDTDQHNSDATRTDDTGISATTAGSAAAPVPPFSASDFGGERTALDTMCATAFKANQFVSYDPDGVGLVCANWETAT